MKKNVLSFLLVCLVQTVIFAQSPIDSLSYPVRVFQLLTKYNWEKNYVDMQDGSILQDPTAERKTVMCLVFRKNGTGSFIQGEQASSFRFRIIDSLITINEAIYKIDKIDDYEMTFSVYAKNLDESEKFRFHYLATKDTPGNIYLRKLIKPNIVVDTPKKDTTFLFNQEVYPKFRGNSEWLRNVPDFEQAFEDTYGVSYNFIEDEFVSHLPKDINTRFEVSFDVTTRGLVENILITSSTNPEYNPYLIAAIQNTSRKWLPARWKEKNYRSRIQYAFQTEKEDPKAIAYDPEIYDNFYNRAMGLMARKKYDKAVSLLTKCILMTEDSIDALYKRAECYQSAGIMKYACMDWSFLTSKGLKRAEKLYWQNCKE